MSFFFIFMSVTWLSSVGVPGYSVGTSRGCAYAKHREIYGFITTSSTVAHLQSVRTRLHTRPVWVMLAQFTCSK